VLGVVFGGGFRFGTHAYNIFERGWIDVPNW